MPPAKFWTKSQLPGIITDGIPALIGTTNSKVFTDHFNALHDSHMHIIVQTESSKRIIRARHTRVRTAEDNYI